MFYASYNPDTGEILRSGQCAPDDLELQVVNGQAVMVRESCGHHDGIAYVDLSNSKAVISERPHMPASLNKMTITGIPKGAVLTIDDTNYTVNDGEAELSFNAAGTYRVKLSLFPYLDQTFEVIAP